MPVYTPTDVHAHCEQAFRFIDQNTGQSPPWPLLGDAVSAYKTAWHDGGFLMDCYYALPGLSCVAVGGHLDKATPLTAAWILYDLASDIFDDLQDQDKADVPWLEWPPAQAMLVGLGCLFAAARCQASLQIGCDASRAIQIAIAEAGLAAAQGQAIATDARAVDGYFRRIIANTGGVFAAIAWSGARVHSSDPQVLTALHKYGLALGILLQLRDDCIDLSNGEVASDLERGGYTLPLLYGLSQTEHPAHSRLRDLLQRGKELDKGDVQEILHFVADVGAWSFMEGVVKVYQHKAFDALATLPTSQTQLLREYIENIFPNIDGCL